LSINFKEVRVDMIYKEYSCPNGHKTIYKRYGEVVEINGVKRYGNELYVPPANPKRFRKD